MFIKYFEMGYSVIPVYFRSKNPIMDGWSRYCNTKPTEQEIEKWQEIYDSQDFKYNITVCGGPASNIIAIDIDVENDEIFNKVYDIVPVSPVRRRGKKGEVRFFQYDKSINSQSIADVIDIIGNTRHVLLPPSVHIETRKPYVWLTDDTFENVKPHELPRLDFSFFEEVRSLVASDEKIKSIARPGRNNKLVSVVTARLAEQKPFNEVVEYVYNWDLERHIPRLFTDPEEQYRATTEDEAYQASAIFVASVMSSNLKRGSLKIERPTLAVEEKELTKLKPQAAFKPKPYPKARGLMGEFCTLCEMVSSGNQDTLSIGGAISMMSGLVANRFVTQVRGLETCGNTYTINLAPSSFGKETALKLIHELLFETNLLGSASYRSGSSIVMGLPKQQERVDLIDECSSLLRAMGGREDYKAEIVEVLSTLYSKANSKFLGFSSLNSGEKYGACYNPNISILGATTPAGFKGSIQKDMAAKGLLPRFFLFIQHDLGKYKGRQDRGRSTQLLESIKEKIKAILEFEKKVHPDFKPEINYLAEQRTDDNKDISQGIRYQPHIVPFSNEAHEYWLDFDEWCHNEKQKDPDGFESAFIGRFAELTAKLALLDAISLSETEEISIDNVKWAREVVETQWHNAKPLYELASTDNAYENSLVQVLREITKYGSIKRSDLFQKFKKLKSKQMQEIIQALEDQGKVARVRVQTVGRPYEMIQIKGEIDTRNPSN